MSRRRLVAFRVFNNWSQPSETAHWAPNLVNSRPISHRPQPISNFPSPIFCPFLDCSGSGLGPSHGKPKAKPALPASTHSIATFLPCCIWKMCERWQEFLCTNRCPSVCYCRASEALPVLRSQSINVHLHRQRRHLAIRTPPCTDDPAYATR